ncbi:MAG: hypothetical protein IJS40_02810 [Synergistaceae bacterium]|nr:hypothetical protein [Synergistaceae bacterium]
MKKFLLFLMISALCFSMTESAYADDVSDLFYRYVPQVKPEKVTLIISGQPDSTGLINEAYAEGKGAVVKNISFNSSFTVKVNGLQLNPVSEWKNGDNVRFKGLSSILLSANILESDINAAIKNNEFKFWHNGRRFIVHDVVADITSGGIKVNGLVKEDTSVNAGSLKSYAAAWLLGAAADDYPIEVNSKLKIENNGKEIWLDNPTVTSDYTAISGYVEKNITNRNKALVNLNELKDVQVTLGNIALSDGSLTISTATLPTALTSGTTYTYPRSSSNNGTTNNDNTNTNETTQTVTSDDFDPISDTAIFSSADVLNAIATKLGTLATNFPFQTTGVTSGNTKNITNTQLNSALSGKTWNDAKIFPTQRAATAGTYPLGSISLTPGKKIALYMLTETASGGFSLASNSANVKVAETVSNGTFFMDTDGNIVEKVPASGEVIAVAPMEANTEYTPVITLADEGNPLGSSSSGCELGLSAVALTILGFAFFKKH